jgi:hypothetical protein
VDIRNTVNWFVFNYGWRIKEWKLKVIVIEL